MVRAPHQFPVLLRSTVPRLSLSFDSSTIITAHDDKSLVQSVEPAAFNAGGVDIARSAPHTLLIQRDGLYTYLMAVFTSPTSTRCNNFLAFLFYSSWFWACFIVEDGSHSFIWICSLYVLEKFSSFKLMIRLIWIQDSLKKIDWLAAASKVDCLPWSPFDWNGTGIRFMQPKIKFSIIRKTATKSHDEEQLEKFENQTP